LKQYDPKFGAKPSTFIYTCVNRHMIKLLRNAQKRKYEAVLNKGEEASYYSDIDPLNQLIIKEKVAEVYSFIEQKLTDFERKVLLLYLSGMKTSLIAESLKLDFKKVDNALQRAKNKIKSNITKL